MQVKHNDNMCISVVWVVKKKKKVHKKEVKKKKDPDLPTYFFQTCYSNTNFLGLSIISKEAMSLCFKLGMTGMARPSQEIHQSFVTTRGIAEADFSSIKVALTRQADSLCLILCPLQR